MNGLRILHIASFTGNIGDNASHIGLYRILQTILGDSFEVERLEIRKFYKNYSLPDKMCFDDEFAKKANSVDLLIIGGGGFLDYWVPKSETGTTIDISEKVLSKISVPTFFVSVGSIPHKPVPEGNVEKFHHFLQVLSNKDNVRMAVRNDGSIYEINRLFGNEFKGRIDEILDNGFFYELPLVDMVISDKPYVAVNSTLDQLTMQNRLIGKIDYVAFKNEVSSFLQRIIKETDYSIVFIPHIFKDLQAFREILEGINDFYIRSRIIIAPYVQGDYGCNMLMSIYKNAKAVVGMRFHANVCPVAMGKRVVGLAALDRVVHMYNSIGRRTDVVSVDNSFSDTVFERVMATDCQVEMGVILERKRQTLGVYKKYLMEML